MSPTLLSNDELALIRGWLHGLPLAALVDFCHGLSPFETLRQCRNKLILKARRLQLDGGNDWRQHYPNPKQLSALLRQLETLQNSPDLAPDIQQPLQFWLPDDALEKMQTLNLNSVADWQAMYRQYIGKNWWEAVPGLGASTAQGIEKTLAAHFPDILHKPTPPATKTPRQTAIVPMAHFLLPEQLNGTAGNNRSPNSPFIPANDDYQAIQCWLARLQPASHSHRSYQREAERLLLWTILNKHKALSSLDMADMAEYRQFLCDPQPAELWIGAPQKKGTAAWKPFTGPLSQRSRRFSETVLNGLFNFLVTQHYLLHNPLQALPKLKDSNAHRPLGTHRSFTEAQFQQLDGFINSQTAACEGKQRLKWLRIRLIVQLGFGTGLRLHELAQIQVGDLETRQRQGQTQYWLSVLGKGQKWREVPIPLPLYLLIHETYRELVGKSLLRSTPDSPLIPPLSGAQDRALTPLSIHTALKSAFAQAAGHFAETEPETAAKLQEASTHWLRHTHGSVAVERNIPLTMIRDNLGHSNIATTSHYVHADEDARHDAFAQGFTATKTDV